MAQTDELRMIAKVAKMYYDWDMKQSEIANQLELSQATVSRLLRRSKEEGIIRISVNIPEGVFTDLEERIARKYNLHDVIVVDARSENENLIQRDLGAAAAYYFENMLRPNEIIGLSSWSATLMAMVDYMRTVPKRSGVKVVQILGGVGSPAVAAHASRLLAKFAQYTNAEAVYLPVAGVLSTEAARDALVADNVTSEAIKLFDQVTTAFVGIGAIDPSPILAQSGNIFSKEEMRILRENNATGDILLRFYDQDGNLVNTGLEKRVISMSLEQLSKVHRAIGVAGGARKYAGILGALRGHWINILITDQYTAEKLAQE